MDCYDRDTLQFYSNKRLYTVISGAC